VGFPDRHGRTHDDLRISVTDRCNLRCTYCMPEEPVWFPRDEVLSFEEILRIVRALIPRGVRRFRITGGEPLLRRDIVRLVAMLAETAGVEDLSLTTNGILLAPMARALAHAGLRRINVSLDTLRPERFARIARRDALGRVLDGIGAAAAAGLAPLKINTVLLRGVNDDEAEALVERARDEGWEVRFIEFMPLENGDTWDPGRVVTGGEIRRRIETRWPLEPDTSERPNAPATRFLFRDGRGSVGFINSVSEPFCDLCSRIRLTSDGKLRVCLYDSRETDLKALVRGGGGDDALRRAVARAVNAKGRGGAVEIIERNSRLPLIRTMHQIGG
jgi:cyclic pyranopterin phosphate synthase